MKKFIVLIAGLGLLSCQSFLEEKLVSGVEYSYYDTEVGIEDLVRSAYVPLRAWGGQETGVRMSNFGTDIWEFTNVSSGNEFHMFTSALNPSNSNFYSIWQNFYLGISRCNIAIDRIPSVEGTDFLRTEEGRNMRIAEATFLRAYYYFMLVQIFGEVPLLRDENIGILTDIKRVEVPQIYQSVITDLRFSVEHLPEGQSDYARPTQAAAAHLLAKVYLTRGSAVTESRGQQPSDMDSAAYYAEHVISAKGDLLPDFDDARRVDNEKNKEVLFAVQYTTNPLYNGGGNGNHLFYTIQYMTVGGLTLDMDYGQAWVRLRPTDYLYDLFDLQNDSRFYKSFKTTYLSNFDGTIPVWQQGDAPTPSQIGKPKFAVGDTALYFTMDAQVSDEEIASKPYTWRPRNKFTDRVFPSYQYHLDPYKATESTTEGTLDFKLFWLSESYLIAAEAYGRNGDYTKAAELINVVRRRAAYKDGEEKPKQFYENDGGDIDDLVRSTETAMEITASDINSYEKLRDFILEERAREFCGDNERWFDLVRTETFFDRVVQYNKEGSEAVREFHKLRPIPQNHIDRISDPGPLSEEQNEGYF